jgi:hypothetical protein
VRPRECSHEPAIVSLVMAGRWPDAADPPSPDGFGVASEELQAHARACPVCIDVVEVAMLLRTNYQAFGSDVRVPAAGQVWWRAAVRARMEGAQAAARPITWLQGVAGACAAALGCVVLASSWPAMRTLAGWFFGLLTGIDPRAVAVPIGAVVEQSLPLVLSVVGLVVVVPLAVLCFALSNERD